MSKHLVFVGGGHAHLSALLGLADYVRKGYRVSLVSPSPYHYYSGMGPGLLAGIYQPRQVRFHIRKMVEDRGGAFVSGQVVRIDAEDRVLHLDGGRCLGYDIVSFNTGSKVPTEGIAPGAEAVFPVKPITNLHKAQLALRAMSLSRPLEVAVIGGGAAGVEIASSVWRLARDNRLGAGIRLIAGNGVLAGFPSRARRLVRASFAERGIEIIAGTRLVNIRNHVILLSSGNRLHFDFAFVATGVAPSEIFKTSGAPTGASGGLLVNHHLQSIAHAEIFGGGDCIDLDGRALAKVGVHAVRQGSILKENLMAALEGSELKAFEPDEDYLLILNLGNGKGLLSKKGWVVDGRFAFLLKDYIDRRFMRRFQVSGELAEEAPVASSDD